MVLHPALLLDQLCHPPRTPQPDLIAQRLGAALQSLLDAPQILGAQTRSSPRVSGFFQRPHSALLQLRRPTANRLPMHSHLPCYFGGMHSLAQELQQTIDASLPNDSAVLDGEIVCLDPKGKPRFNDLLFRRGDPCLFAFDLLFVNGQDMRTAQLSDRKHELRRLLSRDEGAEGRDDAVRVVKTADEPLHRSGEG